MRLKPSTLVFLVRQLHFLRQHFADAGSISYRDQNYPQWLHTSRLPVIMDAHNQIPRSCKSQINENLFLKLSNTS